MGFLKQARKKQCDEAAEFTQLARNDFGQLAEGAVIFPPFRCEHPEHMFFGQVVISANGWMGAVTEYAGTSYSPRLEVANGTSFGRGIHLFCCARMVIGQNVMIADNVYISDNLHGFENINLPPAQQPLYVPGPVSIGDATWIGERACILPNVTIGCHCVIGAGSVVTKSVPDFCVAAGVPARVIRRYDMERKCWVKNDQKKRI